MTKNKSKAPAVRAEPSDSAIRDYAYHLYAQSNRANGHDLANWLEARACLKANIPPHGSRTRLHRYLTG
jgi:hypothetical protein